MPSPFPGMNPYLELPTFWAEVHSRLIVAIADFLMPHIRPKYEVAIEQRIYEINISNEDNFFLVGIPDVTVKGQAKISNYQTSSVAIAPPKTQPITVNIPVPTKIKQNYLEVREIANRQVVTAIEILSPVNKRLGEGREKYLKKRQNILASLTNLVEIDLLRGWQQMTILTENLKTDYQILISRQYCRPQADLYAFNLQDSLPIFPVPLLPEDQEPWLDLGELINEIYERAGFDYRIDYAQDLIPSLSQENKDWVNQVLQEQGIFK